VNTSSLYGEVVLVHGSALNIIIQFMLFLCVTYSTTVGVRRH